MQDRIQRRLSARHAAVLGEYLALVPSASGDDPRLHDLALRIGELEIALERLARGEYGTCLGCGRFIGERRLSKTPLADRCARCDDRPSSAE
jgi:hypothetical protein